MTDTTDSSAKYDTPTGQPEEGYAGHSHNCHCDSCMGFIPERLTSEQLNDIAAAALGIRQAATALNATRSMKWECDQCGERIPSTKLDIEAHQEECEAPTRYAINPSARVRLI